MYVEYATGGSMTGDYSVFQIVPSWVENEATWANASKDIKWTTAGGDYASKAIVRVTWPRSNGYTWIKFNVLSAIQNFVSAPNLNNGFLIRNVSGAQEIDFSGSEHATAANRPKLTVTYEEGTSAALPIAQKPRYGMTINARKRTLNLQAENASAEVFVTLSRPDGKIARNIRVVPGNNHTVTGLAPGIYVLTMHQTGRQTERATVSIVP